MLLEPLRMILLLLVLITGVFAMKPKEIYVKAGDLVMLNCRDCEHDVTVTLWRIETDRKTHLYSNMSVSEQRRLGLVVYQQRLVILSASVHHQGNYSCQPLGNISSQMCFRLTVCPEQSKQCNFGMTYQQTCNANEACTMSCPDGGIPKGIPNMTTNEPKWHKENGDLSQNYFPSVALKDRGVYICTWSFLYSDQTFTTSLTVELNVSQTEQPRRNLGTILPRDGQVFEVELGKAAVITCLALTDSCDSELFWLRNYTFVEENDTLRYFYKYTCLNKDDDKTSYSTNASLIFREVMEEDLSTEFTCKLESDNLPPQLVTITLKKIAGPSYFTLAVSTLCIVVVMAVIVVTYVKFKIDVTLFLRDKLGFKDNTSDGKSYDVFLLSYQSDTDEGLSEEDRRCLTSTLEDHFGYSLCLYDRDVLPGQAVPEAVLDCIEQSRAVVLVPSFPDPEPGSGVLHVIYASLVERKTRLIFINTEKTGVSRSGSFPEALQLLSKAGNSVTWKRRPPSSSFWKQLRYHLPAPQQTPKMQLLTQAY